MTGRRRTARRLLFVVNQLDFFLSHRLALAEGASKAGFEVHVASTAGPGVKRIEALGFNHHALPFTRSGKNPFTELKSLFSLWCLFRQLRPVLVHLVTIKPVIYGGIAARLARIPGVVAAVSGLGYVFVASGSWAKMECALVAWLYRLALGKKNLRVIFQNPDDRDVLIALGAVTKEKAVMIRGSGVDLKIYQVRPEPEGVPVVSMAARLLKDKGVFEFVEAARILKARGIEARFQLVGSPDPGNPTSVTSEDLVSWKEEGVVELLGFRTDIDEIFSNSHIITLPSYGEGLPKVLIEAAACGRAVVTTNNPGCRDATTPGETGLLVLVRDAAALADAIQRLIEDAQLRVAMGLAGRRLAEKVFDIRKVVAAHIEIYRDLERNLEA
jgi:glycosyltransferase involved in cell wall biosynthesis